MKKASDILLLVGGIIDIVAGGALLICLVPTFLLPAGILALCARKKNSQGLIITTLVFAALSFEPVVITGTILALVVQSEEQKKQEKPQVEETSEVVDN